jgi:alkylation response protein AidB-like acyl-CoA dehydrogenase
MMDRALTRKAFGSNLASKGTIQADIADARIMVDQARLLVLTASHAMDVLGSKDARKYISMVQVIVPDMALKVTDLAIMVYGGLGMSHQTPLASWYARHATCRQMDGSTPVHRKMVSRLELRARELYLKSKGVLAAKL